MQSFRRLTGSLFLAVGLTLGFSSSASAVPTPFGSDLAATPTEEIPTNLLITQLAGGPGALPAGYVAPTDGVITGWRVKSAVNGANRLFHFHVVRGNTNIFKGPNVDIGVADGVSATFPVFVPVQAGDTIGLSNDSGALGRELLAGVPGATGLGLWQPPLAADETQPPSQPPLAGTGLLIQADLETGNCGGLRPTIVGTNASDSLLGTAGNDVILANDGNDVVRGLGGDDIICGGAGNDKLKGGLGKDRLFGEAGRDKLNGGGSKDLCFGGAEKDAIGCEKAKQN